MFKCSFVLSCGKTITQGSLRIFLISGWINKQQGFPGGSNGEESACDAGDLGSIPGSGRSPGEGNGNSIQYSGLENPMERGAWQAIVHGVAKSQTTNTFTFLSSPKCHP